MKFFLDTADVDAIRELNELGMVDGVTTNPSLILKAGRNIEEVTREICEMVSGPVSAEVVADKAEDMIREGRHLAQIAPNIAIKVPLTWDGLKACRTFADEGHMVNVTLCFTPAQAILAAKAGATFISPFVGRLDDIGLDGVDLIADIREIYDNYGYETQILAASIRSVSHIIEVGKIGIQHAGHGAQLGQVEIAQARSPDQAHYPARPQRHLHKLALRHAAIGRQVIQHAHRLDRQDADPGAGFEKGGLGFHHP